MLLRDIGYCYLKASQQLCSLAIGRAEQCAPQHWAVELVPFSVPVTGCDTKERRWPLMSGSQVLIGTTLLGALESNFPAQGLQELYAFGQADARRLDN